MLVHFLFCVHMYICVQVNVYRSEYGDQKSTSSVFLTHISILQSEISPSHWLTIMYRDPLQCWFNRHVYLFLAPPTPLQMCILGIKWRAQLVWQALYTLSHFPHSSSFLPFFSALRLGARASHTLYTNSALPLSHIP